MNKIEKSIVDGLNGITSRSGNWKLFANRKVSESMKLSEKETKVYNALVDFLTDKDTTISVLPSSRFTAMLIDWSNEKLIELPSALVDIKTLEKCLKYYFLQNHLTLNRYFCLAMNNSDEKIYIVSVCRESGIYQIKESASSDTSEESSEVVDSDNSTMGKISGHISDIVRLSKDMTTEEKIDIVKTLEKLLEVKATTTVIKKTVSA